VGPGGCLAEGAPVLTPAHDVIVVGGGQAALALGYYLRRSGLSFVLLDAGTGPGGAWVHGWDSLRLFSPARYSSLPGWMMPGGEDEYPHRDAVVEYLARYEVRYGLPIERPVRVTGVDREEGGATSPLVVRTDGGGALPARAVIGATGTWEGPVVPAYPGLESFRGEQLHSAHYRNPDELEGRRVLVVGGGNSGAQLLAEISRVARTRWVTLEPPRFLPDHIDGRDLFNQATAAFRARQEGRPAPAPLNLRDIVMVPPVREARERGALTAVRPPARFIPGGVIWSDGREEAVDVVVWCTGFRPALGWLAPLGLADARGHIRVAGTRSVDAPRLWLVGYGSWTGFASATLIGVGRTARATVEQVAGVLEGG
jgi:putative flavoprotein involved in K+ transport